MSLDSERKQQVIQEYRRRENDTGSAEVQIALLTERINHLTEHLQQHRKDFSSRRGLVMMVGRRSRLLKYLNKTNSKKYQEVIQRLGIRR